MGIIVDECRESLNQVEFCSSLDSSSTIGDVEFAIDALGMGAHCAQGHHKLTGDFRAREFCVEQSENVQLPLAEGFDQRLRRGDFGCAQLLGKGSGWHLGLLSPSC